jgi:hypothetical protein
MESFSARRHRICKLFRLNVCLQMKPCGARQHWLLGISDFARRCTGALCIQDCPAGLGCCLVSARLQRVQWKTNKPGVRSHPRNRADELHRPTALPARWSVVVIGRQA